MRYANSPLKPQHGDIVEWIGNKVKWTVDEIDDISGPSALCHWPDGGWCNVNLISREAKTIIYNTEEEKENESTKN